MSEVKENKSKGSIDIASMVRAVIKQWWVILIISAIAAMCSAIIVTEKYAPTYTTSATFFVSTKNSSGVYSNFTTATSLADVFSVVLNSKVLKEQVAKEAGVSSGDVTINSSVVPETNLLVLNVKAASPRKAYLIMDSVIKNHSIVTDEIMGNAILDVISYPSVPRRPDTMLDATGTMKSAFTYSAVLLVALFALLSFFRDDIKNEGEVDKKLDTTLLTTVYHENKYKTLRSRLHKVKRSVLITDPTTSFAFLETYRKLRTKIEYQAKKEDIKSIIVTSVMENEGKSTVAANLALALAQKHRVLLIDADLRKPAIYKVLGQDVKDKIGLVEVLKEKKGLGEAVYFDRTFNLYLLIGSKLAANSSELVATDHMRRIIKSASDQLDFVVIDTPPLSCASDAETLSDMVDASVLVVQQSRAVARDINDGIDALSSSSAKLLGCVYNNARKRVFPTAYVKRIYGEYSEYDNYRKYGEYGNYARRKELSAYDRHSGESD
ncbi:MAG: polysaccharide biosynthesis tyrosine autokinase [Clostridia bacterium]|nr:polysaccharide biosynthesis tyrosine autokinase [Clostridia bacterium]